MWRTANLEGERLTWRRGEDGSIRLEIAVERGRVIEDVPMFDAKPTSMGRTT